MTPSCSSLASANTRLARRNALLIRHESFRSDAGRLVTAIERLLAVVLDTGADLVTGWQLVDQRKDQAYRWPDLFEHYDRYHVYRGETQREGIVFISLGRAVRPGAWGMDRRYVVSFLSRGAPQTPLAEFLAADDYDETRELIAIIRGRDGGSKMYGPADDLPPAYAGFRTATYRDRVQAKGSWNKLAVVAASPVELVLVASHGKPVAALADSAIPKHVRDPSLALTDRAANRLYFSLLT